MKNLKPGNTYILKYTHQFCHALGKEGYKDFSKNMNTEDRIEAIFIGSIIVKEGKRNIFYNIKGSNRSYIMFAAENVDYIVHAPQQHP